MTVAELIAELQKLPPDSPVVVWNDNGSGYERATEPTTTLLKPRERGRCEYTFAQPGDDGAVTAVYLY